MWACGRAQRDEQAPPAPSDYCHPPSISHQVQFLLPLVRSSRQLHTSFVVGVFCVFSVLSAVVLHVPHFAPALLTLLAPPVTAKRFSCISSTAPHPQPSSPAVSLSLFPFLFRSHQSACFRPRRHPHSRTRAAPPPAGVQVSCPHLLHTRSRQSAPQGLTLAVAWARLAR